MQVTPEILRAIANLIEQNKAYVETSQYSVEGGGRHWLNDGSGIIAVERYGVGVDVGANLEIKIRLLESIYPERKNIRDRPGLVIDGHSNEQSVDRSVGPYDRSRRERRAERLISNRRSLDLIRPFANHYWTVPSTKDDTIRYETSIIEQTCTCLDYQQYKKACKHIIAVEMIVIALPKESVVILVKIVKVIMKAWLDSFLDAVERMCTMIKVIVKVWAEDVVDGRMVRVSLLELK